MFTFAFSLTRETRGTAGRSGVSFREDERENSSSRPFNSGNRVLYPLLPFCLRSGYLILPRSDGELHHINLERQTFMSSDISNQEPALMTLSYFSDHVNSPFTLDVEVEGNPIEVTLTEASPLKPTPKGPGIPEAIRDDPFALVFRGPGNVQLAQRLYQITHETLGELQIFLVPIAADEEGRYYEAVFN